MYLTTRFIQFSVQIWRTECKNEITFFYFQPLRITLKWKYFLLQIINTLNSFMFYVAITLYVESKIDWFTFESCVLSQKTSAECWKKLTILKHEVNENTEHYRFDKIDDLFSLLNKTENNCCGKHYSGGSFQQGATECGWFALRHLE